MSRWVLIVAFLLGTIVSVAKAQSVSSSPEYLTTVEADSVPGPVIELPPVASGPSKPEYPKVRLTGFFQADMGWVSQDANSIATVGDVQDGADFRRARLAAVGQVAENVGYQVEFDFAFPGRPSFMDVWLELQESRLPGAVRMGNYRQPIGLDGLTSVKELTFIERSLPFAFLPFRQIGVMNYGNNDAAGTTWAVSGFRFPTDVYGGQIGDDGGYGFAGRWTKLIVDVPELAAVHIGGAYSLADPANDAVQFRSQPEFFMSETGGNVTPVGVPSTVPPFVDTGAINTRTVQYFSGELAATNGPFHTQTEYLMVNVDRPGVGGVSFSGVSTQVAWLLTGEHRPYNRKAGVLGRVVPNQDFSRCGWGAWELAARWSYLDLTDADVLGGELNNTTIGVNWYWNANTKFQFNYVRSQLDHPTSGDSNADIVAFRAQVDF